MTQTNPFWPPARCGTCDQPSTSNVTIYQTWELCTGCRAPTHSNCRYGVQTYKTHLVCRQDNMVLYYETVRVKDGFEYYCKPCIGHML